MTDRFGLVVISLKWKNRRRLSVVPQCTTDPIKASWVGDLLGMRLWRPIEYRSPGDRSWCPPLFLCLGTLYQFRRQTLKEVNGKLTVFQRNDEIKCFLLWVEWTLRGLWAHELSTLMIDFRRYVWICRLLIWIRARGDMKHATQKREKCYGYPDRFGLFVKNESLMGP